MLADILKREEGFRSIPYRDSDGWSIGYGHYLGCAGSTSAPILSITKATAEEWLDQDIAIANGRAYDCCVANGIGEVSQLGDRYWLLVLMAYQMGMALGEFKMMFAALKRLDWHEAANQMLDSLWARQTPARAKRMADAMRAGSLAVLTT